MTRRMIHIAGVLSTLASIGAQAQTLPVQLNMDRGLYIGAAAGKARTGEGCLGTCDTTNTTWRAYAGYQFNRHLAVEAGYVDFGKATVSATLAGVPVTSRIETSAWELVGVGLLPLTERFSIYGKLGLFRYESDATTSGAFVGATSASGTEFTLGAGVQYAITSNFAARFEWQHYTDVGAGIPGAEKDDISVWRLGGRYQF